MQLSMELEDIALKVQSGLDKPSSMLLCCFQESEIKMASADCFS